jgi:hypothetical protein
MRRREFIALVGGPFLKTLFADSGYQGPKFAKALAKVLPWKHAKLSP